MNIHQAKMAKINYKLFFYAIYLLIIIVVYIDNSNKGAEYNRDNSRAHKQLSK